MNIKVNKLNGFISILTILVSGLFLLVSDALANARSGLNIAAGENGANLSKADVPSVIGSVIGAVLSFVGVLFLGLMIYGGLLWMTAQGNEQQVTKAKDLIVSAVIGLVIVMSAYAITAFVGQSLGAAVK